MELWFLEKLQGDTWGWAREWDGSGAGQWESSVKILGT